MIAPTARGCKRAIAGAFEFACDGGSQPALKREICRHGIVSRIIILPNFRLSAALLDCEKEILRWPGPFGSGFLSPQPPGVVRIGPVRKKHTPTLGQRKLVLFLFGLLVLGQRFRAAKDCFSTASRRWRQKITHRGAIAGLSQARSSALRPATKPRETKNIRPFSEARYTPRPASGLASRDCRPGYKPPRHRRPRGRYFPAAQSSFRTCRSSRRLSAGYAPHYSR